MDLNIITRVESHANDLFKKGLPPIPEGEETVYGVRGEKLKKGARSKLRERSDRVRASVFRKDGGKRLFLTGLWL